MLLSREAVRFCKNPVKVSKCNRMNGKQAFVSKGEKDIKRKHGIKWLKIINRKFVGFLKKILTKTTNQQKWFYRGHFATIFYNNLKRFLFLESTKCLLVEKYDDLVANRKSLLPIIVNWLRATLRVSMKENKKYARFFDWSKWNGAHSPHKHNEQFLHQCE